MALRSDGPPPDPVATSDLPPAPTAADITASLAPASWPVLDPPLDGIGSAGAPEWIVDGCDNVNPENVARCAYGPPDAERTAALVGDSMAISWLPALREVLEPRGWRIQVLTRNQCPAVDVLLYRDRPEVPYVECAEHREWVVEQVAELEPDLVLVSSAETMVDKQVEQPQGDLRYSRWADGLTRAVRDLQRHSRAGRRAGRTAARRQPAGVRHPAEPARRLHRSAARALGGRARRRADRRPAHRRRARRPRAVVLRGRPLPGGGRQHAGVHRRAAPHLRLRAPPRAAPGQGRSRTRSPPDAV